MDILTYACMTALQPLNGMKEKILQRVIFRSWTKISQNDIIRKTVKKEKL